MKTKCKIAFVFVCATTVFSSASVAPDLYFDNGLYSTWYESSGDKYEASILLNSSDNSAGSALFWSIDRNNESITIAVGCPVSTGWCAFGISETGGMQGADMVIFESQTNALYDAHVLDDINAGPIRDSCQNWKLLNSIVSDESAEDAMILFEATRSLRARDTFDRIIIDDSDFMIPPTLVISAWLDTPTVSYHGKNVARSALRLFRSNDSLDQSAFTRSMEELAEGSFELRAVDYPVPEIETYYAHVCFTYADLIAMGVPEDGDLHIIGIEPLVATDTKEFVHHFVLDASLDLHEELTSPIPEDICAMLDVVESPYGWAPGGTPFAYPDNIGGPLGANGYKTFRLQIHYDNPSLKSGFLDNSGVRMHWTSTKREHDMGTLSLADPGVALIDQMVGNGITHHNFECPGSCSSAFLTEPVTVVRTYFHMHRSGVRMYNEHIRNGTVIRTTGVDFFDFDQQGDFTPQQASYQILPGDSFRTRCFYKADDEIWGLSSQNEMCMSTLYYYPRKVLDVGIGVPLPYTCAMGMDFFEACNAVYSNTSVLNTIELNRRFGSDNGICEDQGDNGTTSGDSEAKSSALPVSSSPSFLLYLIAVFGLVLVAR